MIASSDDFAACRATLARGSKSFHFAWRFLPARLSDPFAALYAFCRVTDDAIDESRDPRAALDRCLARTDAIFAGRPLDDAIDRAFASVAHERSLPRAPIDALLDGYRWDVEQRAIATMSDLHAYAARVAGAVGVASTYLVGARDRATLARAADLGIAMQLTNVVRDVGEDACRGRVYLPREWLEGEGVVLDRSPRHDQALGRVVRRVLDHADALYARADAGIARLPADVRPAIRAASALYREIGNVVRESGYDVVSGRATTSPARKVLSLARSLAVAPRTCDADEPPLPEAEMLLPPA